MTALAIHLEESSKNLMRHENFDKLITITEEILDTLKFLCIDENTLQKQYFSNNEWVVDFVTHSTSVHKFWNCNLLLDTAFYLRTLELKFGNTSKFWDAYEQRENN